MKLQRVNDNSFKKMPTFFKEGNNKIIKEVPVEVKHLWKHSENIWVCYCFADILQGKYLLNFVLRRTLCIPGISHEKFF